MYLIMCIRWCVVLCVSQFLSMFIYVSENVFCLRECFLYQVVMGGRGAVGLVSMLCYGLDFVAMLHAFYL